jgi:hypothetical protein
LEVDFENIKPISTGTCHWEICFGGLKNISQQLFDLCNLFLENVFHMCDIFGLPGKNAIFI